MRLRRNPAEDLDVLLEIEPLGRFSRRRWIRAVAVGVLIAVLAGAVALYLSWRNGDGLRYVTGTAHRGDLEVIVTATGSIQPTTRVDVSSELSGIVRRVLVDFNSAVTAGQVLAELDTAKLLATVENSRAKLAAAQAKVAEAEVTVRESEREYARKRSLAGSRITSERDIDIARAVHYRATAVLESARAEVGVAEADLRLNETNLAKAFIRSPIDGVVLQRSVDPGQTVASSFQAPILFSIAEDLTQMEVQVDVDEADIGQVREGQNATFSVDAYPDRRFPATIRELRFASETIQGVVTYKAVLTVDNEERLLRPGMTATADIVAREVTDALLVPNGALRFSPPAVEPPPQEVGFFRRLLPAPRFRAPSQPPATEAARQVWVLENGIPQAVRVVVGASDGSFTEIVDGALEPGTDVVVDSITPAAR